MELAAADNPPRLSDSTRTLSGVAQRIDAVRSFFCDLIEWEWITPRLDSRRVISLPVSARAGLDPDQTIIDDAAWTKLMAAGLTLTADDLRATALREPRPPDGTRCAG